MKKTLFAIAALAAMTSCSQEMTNIEPQQPKGQTVTIEAKTSETKAAVGNDGVNVFWRDNDAISVFVKEADNTWSKNTQFTKKVKGNINDFTFNGTFATPLKDGANSWFLLHPYDAAIHSIGIETPSKEGVQPDPSKITYKTGTDGTKNYAIEIMNSLPQDGNQNARAHIHMPMYGFGTGNGATTPNITMAHFCGLFEVTVNNPSTTESMNVTSVAIEAPQGKELTGPFRIRVHEATTDKPAYMNLIANTAATEKAELRVRNTIIAANGSAKFYIMTAPFTVTGTETAPVTMKVTVKTDKDALTVSKEIKTSKDFAAGKVHKTIVDYTGATAFETTADISSGTLDFTKMTEVPAWIITRNGTFNASLNNGLVIPGHSTEKHRALFDTKQKFTKITITRSNNKGGCKVALKDSKTGAYSYTVEFTNKENDKNGDPVLAKTIEIPTGETANGIRFDIGKADVTIAKLDFVVASTTHAQ